VDFLGGSDRCRTEAVASVSFIFPGAAPRVFHGDDDQRQSELISGDTEYWWHNISADEANTIDRRLSEIKK
jgi:hypothetical protein